MTSADDRTQVPATRTGRARRQRRLLLENGLSIVLIAVFLASWGAQALIGLRAYNGEREEHGSVPIDFGTYLSSGHFIEATAENWESEFLQMAAFVWLTSFLFQKGSPESKGPYNPDSDEPPISENSPWPVRHGGWVLKLYGSSLSVAFGGMFLIAFLLHAWGGASVYSEDQVEHGQVPVSMARYMTTSRFWFESLQNWQSEFLAIAAMVILGIFLRQKGSPQSKPVTTPHARNK